MKPIILISFLLLLIPAKNLFPQAKFEKGYVISLQDDTIYGLIKNYDRVKNPAGAGLKITRLSFEVRYKIGDGITVPGSQVSTETKTEQLSFVLGFRIL